MVVRMKRLAEILLDRAIGIFNSSFDVRSIFGLTLCNQEPRLRLIVFSASKGHIRQRQARIRFLMDMRQIMSTKRFRT